MATYTIEIIGRGHMADRDAVEIRLRCLRDGNYFQFFQVIATGIALAIVRREHGDVPETWWRAAVATACTDIESMVTSEFRPLDPPTKGFMVPVDVARTDALHKAGGLPAGGPGDEVCSFTGP